MKKLIIDGHNLIPKIPGLHLKDMDDEVRLIEILQEYCRLARREAELFFDGAPEQTSSNRKNGLVHAHFVKIGYSADDAIINWLRNRGKNTTDIVVVSSDHRIQTEARSLGVKSMPSDEFALEIKRVFNSPAKTQEMKEKPLSSNEVDEWMQFFNEN